MSGYKLSVEQQKILTTTGNILVNASAGSGKTTMMIEKVLTLLRGGADIRKILIMTFTEDAASEMKTRLVEKIYAEIRSYSADSAKLKKQLEYLPFASIGTMDSYWKKLYQKYFAVINKDPACNIVEANAGKVLLEQSIMDVFEQYIAQNDERFFKLAEVMSTQRKLDKFANNIVYLRNFITAQVDEEQFIANAKQINPLDKNSTMAEYVHSHFIRRFRIIKQETEHLLGQLLAEEKIKFVEAYQIFIDGVDKLVKSKDFAQFSANVGFLSPPPKVGRFIRGHELVKDFASLVDSITKLVSDAQSYAHEFTKKEQNTDDVAKLLEILSKVEQVYSQAKAQNNLLDFNDLSKYAVKILDNEQTREEVKKSFDYIFVDEYQDTNYRQEHLLMAISNGDNLFVVGDVKQAIYQFRNAEPAIFLARKNVYENLQTGTNIPLKDNYRSNKQILDFVDSVCGELMTDEFGGVDYKNTAEFGNSSEYEKVDALPVVNVTVLPKVVEGKAPSDSIYKVDCADMVTESHDLDYLYVAQTIVDLVGKTKLYNRKSKQTSIAKYADMAILIQKWTQAYEMGKVLDSYNIPYNILNNQRIDSQERQLLIDFLSILHNPTDDIKLANVLSSPIVNFSYKELLDMRINNSKVPLWESLLAYEGSQNSLQKKEKFLSMLEQLKFMSAYSTVGQLLEKILQSGYDAFLMQRGAKTIAEINAFVDFVKSSEFNNNLIDFLEFYNTSYSGNPCSQIDNAVTITTIFKSKGLEYPIVFLPCLKYSFSKQSTDNIVFADRDFGVAIKDYITNDYVVKDNFAVMAHKLKQKNVSIEEKVRVLYVALTRAENHLFLSGEEGKQISFVEEASSIMDWLEYAKAKNPAIGAKFCYLQSFDHQPPLANTKQAMDKQIDLSILKSFYEYGQATKTYAKMSVSEYVFADNEETNLFNNNIYRSRLAVDASTGIVYHTVLQHIDFSQNSYLQVVDNINNLLNIGVLSSEEYNLVDPKVIFGVLNWQVITKNLDKEFYREQPFMFYADLGSGEETLVQGIVDLVILDEKNSKAIVVDFKVSNASEQNLRLRYKKQLEIYTKAVAKLWGVECVESYIFSLLNGNVIAMDI